MPYKKQITWKTMLKQMKNIKNNTNLLKEFERDKAYIFITSPCDKDGNNVYEKNFIERSQNKKLLCMPNEYTPEYYDEEFNKNSNEQYVIKIENSDGTVTIIPQKRKNTGSKKYNFCNMYHFFHDAAPVQKKEFIIRLAKEIEKYNEEGENTYVYSNGFDKDSQGNPINYFSITLSREAPDDKYSGSGLEEPILKDSNGNGNRNGNNVKVPKGLIESRIKTQANNASPRTKKKKTNPIRRDELKKMSKKLKTSVKEFIHNVNKSKKKSSVEEVLYNPKMREGIDAIIDILDEYTYKIRKCRKRNITNCK